MRINWPLITRHKLVFVTKFRDDKLDAFVKLFHRGKTFANSSGVA